MVAAEDPRLKNRTPTTNLCAVEEVACDPVFLAASEFLASAFFEMRERLPSQGELLP